MRCKNCGWKNPSENKRCEKCQNLLKPQEMVSKTSSIDNNEAQEERDKGMFTLTINENSYGARNALSRNTGSNSLSKTISEKLK